MSSVRLVRLPTRYAVSGKIHGSVVCQFAHAELDASLGLRRISPKGRPRGRILVHDDGSQTLAVHQVKFADPGAANVLLVPDGDIGTTSWPEAIDLRNARWCKPATLLPGEGDSEAWEQRCRAVRDSWKGQFTIREEVRDGDAVVERGLRPPQIGALYAALAHWKVTHEPATVVMPTGTDQPPSSGPGKMLVQHRSWRRK